MNKTGVEKTVEQKDGKQYDQTQDQGKTSEQMTRRAGEEKAKEKQHDHLIEHKPEQAIKTAREGRKGVIKGPTNTPKETNRLQQGDISQAQNTSVNQRKRKRIDTQVQQVQVQYQIPSKQNPPQKPPQVEQPIDAPKMVQQAPFNLKYPIELDWFTTNKEK